MRDPPPHATALQRALLGAARASESKPPQWRQVLRALEVVTDSPSNDTGEIRLFPVLDRSSQFQFNGIFIPARALPDIEANRQFGLAGIAAEAIDGGWDCVVHVLVAKTMSPADAKLAGDFERHHVAETIGLLRWHWGEIETHAEAAMKRWLCGPMTFSNDAALPSGDSGEPAQSEQAR